MATLAQLEIQIQKLQRRAEALRERKSKEVIESIRAMMDEYGLTTKDLAKAGIASGQKRGRPLGSRNGAKSKGKGKVKAQAKTKLPPKYRDPASGATWSGHARPPAWIKDAPDRSMYLIDGAGNASSSKSVKSNGARRHRAATVARAGGVKRAARGMAKKAASETEQAAAA